MLERERVVGGAPSNVMRPMPGKYSRLPMKEVPMGELPFMVCREQLCRFKVTSAHLVMLAVRRRVGRMRLRRRRAAQMLAYRCGAEGGALGLLGHFVWSAMGKLASASTSGGSSAARSRCATVAASMGADRCRVRTLSQQVPEVPPYFRRRTLGAVDIHLAT